MLIFYLRKIILILRLTYLKIYISKVEKMSFKLFDIDLSEVKFLPIDRFAIEPYLNEIKKLDYLKFIVFNFKWFPESYVHRLMVCLPEIFERITYKDLIKIANRVNEPLPIISFLNFIQLFLGVDHLAVINATDIHKTIKQKVLVHVNKTDPLHRVEIKSTFITKEKVGINLSDFYRALKLLKETTPI
jgi:hypothetical protein